MNLSKLTRNDVESDWEPKIQYLRNIFPILYRKIRFSRLLTKNPKVENLTKKWRFWKKSQISDFLKKKSILKKIWDFQIFLEIFGREIFSVEILPQFYFFGQKCVSPNRGWGSLSISTEFGQVWLRSAKSGFRPFRSVHPSGLFWNPLGGQNFVSIISKFWSFKVDPEELQQKCQKTMCQPEKNKPLWFTCVKKKNKRREFWDKSILASYIICKSVFSTMFLELLREIKYYVLLMFFVYFMFMMFWCSRKLGINFSKLHFPFVVYLFFLLYICEVSAHRTPFDVRFESSFCDCRYPSLRESFCSSQICVFRSTASRNSTFLLGNF